MNRTLKRPMFRIGGSAGTGITSGLDRPGYRMGTTVGGQFFPYGPGDKIAQGALDVINKFPARMNVNKQPILEQGSSDSPQIDSSINMTPSIKKESTKERLLRAIGQESGNRNMSRFLTQFGLNLLSQPAQGSGFGGLLSTAATAAKEPTQSLFEDIEEEKNLQRQVALAAEQLDIGQEQAKELQLLKNLDEGSKNAIEQEILARMNDLGETREEASRIVLDKRAYGVLDQPGEVRQKAIDQRSAIIQDQERLSKPAADKKAAFEVDFSKIQKDNEEYDFDLMNPFWDPKRKNYQEGSVYIDYVTGKAFRRDSTQTQNTPIGFVEVPLK